MQNGVPISSWRVEFTMPRIVIDHADRRLETAFDPLRRFDNARLVLLERKTATLIGASRGWSFSTTRVYSSHQFRRRLPDFLEQLDASAPGRSQASSTRAAIWAIRLASG